LLYTGDIAEGYAYLDRAIALYDPAAHRSLATQFAQDARAQSLSYRSLALWLLGYPDAATADADRALSHARDIGQAATLMNMLAVTSFTNIFLGKYQAISAQGNELVALADETRSLYWQARGTCLKGLLFALSDRPAEAVHTLTSGMAARLATGSTAFGPTYLSHLAAAHADLGRFDDAWRCVREAATAVETSKERWYEAEVNRIAGGIALKSPEPDAAKAEGYFERAFAVARAQQAKSWELRAAMSMARLWRDQGKRDEARDLLAPVYGWFTEGFDTRDLKEAKTLLDELAS
jgi:predicted ATPase